MFESMGALRDIYIKIILTIFDLVPEIKWGSAILPDEFLSVYEISDDRLHAQFLDQFSLQTLESGFSRLQSTAWQTIKSTSSISRNSFTQVYFSFMDNNSANFRRDKKWLVLHENRYYKISYDDSTKNLL